MDDAQAYLHCLASDAVVAVQVMNQATDALVAWMLSNCLGLNPSKSQFILLGTQQQLDLCTLATESLPLLAFTTTVQDFSVTLDQELAFTQHIHELVLSSISLLNFSWVRSTSE